MLENNEEYILIEANRAYKGTKVNNPSLRQPQPPESRVRNSTDPRRILANWWIIR